MLHYNVAHNFNIQENFNFWRRKRGEYQSDIPGAGRPSPKFNEDVKIPNGKAPIPKDIWKPPSPNPKAGNVCYKIK